MKKSDGTPGSLGMEPREEWTQIEDNYEALQIQPLSDPFIVSKNFAVSARSRVRFSPGANFS